MWKQCRLHISDFVPMQRQCHAEPVAVHGKRDLRRSTLEIHHGHDDVALHEPPTEVAELVIGGELPGATVAIRVLFLAWRKHHNTQQTMQQQSDRKQLQA